MLQWLSRVLLENGFVSACQMTAYAFSALMLLVRLTWVVPEKGPLNGFVCVCVRVG